MLCPYCLHNGTRVADKRDAGQITKRRRECLKCMKRFNTLEAIERVSFRVIKKDGSQEEFDHDKLRRGIVKACEKRPVGAEAIDAMVAKIEQTLQKRGKQATSTMIGEMISRELKKTDSVAYIRFASVYREFKDVGDFKKEIKELAR